MGHGFAILLPHVGTLRPFGAPAPVNSALGVSGCGVVALCRVGVAMLSCRCRGGIYSIASTFAA